VPLDNLVEKGRRPPEELESQHNHKDGGVMQPRPPYMENPDKLEIATEVLSSAIKVLKAGGFYENEISELFEQVARKPERAPLWLKP